MPTERPEPPYPNRLRELREALALTRARLAALTVQIASDDPVRFTAVGESTVKHLETGRAQPRASTAATLARALNAEVAQLFPCGIDTKSRLPNRQSTVN